MTETCAACEKLARETIPELALGEGWDEIDTRALAVAFHQAHLRGLSQGRVGREGELLCANPDCPVRHLRIEWDAENGVCLGCLRDELNKQQGRAAALAAASEHGDIFLNGDERWQCLCGFVLGDASVSIEGALDHQRKHILTLQPAPDALDAAVREAVIERDGDWTEAVWGGHPTLHEPGEAAAAIDDAQLALGERVRDACDEIVDAYNDHSCFTTPCEKEACQMHHRIRALDLKALLSASAVKAQSLLRQKELVEECCKVQCNLCRIAFTKEQAWAISGCYTAEPAELIGGQWMHKQYKISKNDQQTKHRWGDCPCEAAAIRAKLGVNRG